MGLLKRLRREDAVLAQVAHDSLDGCNLAVGCRHDLFRFRIDARSTTGCVWHLQIVALEFVTLFFLGSGRQKKNYKTRTKVTQKRFLKPNNSADKKKKED